MDNGYSSDLLAIAFRALELIKVNTFDGRIWKTLPFLFSSFKLFNWNFIAHKELYYIVFEIRFRYSTDDYHQNNEIWRQGAAKHFIIL